MRARARAHTHTHTHANTRAHAHTHTNTHIHTHTHTVGFMHTKSTPNSYFKGRNEDRQRQTGAKTSCFLVFSLDWRWTYLKATEKVESKWRKIQIINISNDRIFSIINKTAPINLKWQPKLSRNKSRTWKYSFCNTLAELGERGQPAESKENNRLLILAFHGERDEELNRLVI